MTGTLKELNSLRQDIARGLTETPVDKVVKFRALWHRQGYDVPPMVEASRRPATKQRNEVRRREGIGDRLIKIIHKEAPGVAGCSDCRNAAQKLNEMTASEVKSDIDNVVADIMSRAAEKAPRLWQRMAVRLDVAAHKSRLTRKAHKIASARLTGENVDTTATAARIKRWVLEACEKPMRYQGAAFRKVVRNFRRAAKRSGPDVTKIELQPELRRNLIYHIYPMTKTRWLWQWNLDQIIERIDLFNGRRVVGIVHDSSSDSPDAVKEYLQGHDIEYIVEKNDVASRPENALGETVTAIKLMEAVHSFENEVTFRAHAKGVTKSFGQLPEYKETFSGRFSENGETVQQWTEIMYATCLDDWQSVKSHLEQFAMTGPYRRNTRMGPAAWFYSGSFYWYRHLSFYQRDWRNISQARTGVESLPGLLFNANEVGCLHGDDCASMYHHTYMKDKAWPEFEKWKRGTVPNRVLTSGRLTSPNKFAENSGTLHDLVTYAETSPSDINEHVHSLRSLAERCDHVTEFGVRFGVSTVAFLSGKPKTLRSYDITAPSNIETLRSVVPDGTDWRFQIGDTRVLEIEETDMLFIDTLHEYSQLRSELALHGNRARKYLVFHDTVTFGERGELGGGGLNSAIAEFQASNPHWVMMADFKNCNGLKVLRREN